MRSERLTLGHDRAVQPRVVPRCLPAALLATVVLGSTAGCGSGGFEFAPVSGTVTMNGNPLPGVTVTFQPQSSGTAAETGPGSYGVTDEQGRYTLQVVGRSTEGAIVGRHRVTFAATGPERAADDDSAAATPRLGIPPNVLNKQLEFEVPTGGADAADFELGSG